MFCGLCVSSSSCSISLYACMYVCCIVDKEYVNKLRNGQIVAEPLNFEADRPNRKRSRMIPMKKDEAQNGGDSAHDNDSSNKRPHLIPSNSSHVSITQTSAANNTSSANLSTNVPKHIPLTSSTTSSSSSLPSHVPSSASMHSMPGQPSVTQQQSGRMFALPSTNTQLASASIATTMSTTSVSSTSSVTAAASVRPIVHSTYPQPVVKTGERNNS